MLLGLATMLLAAILAVSGAAKLLDVRATAATLREFGLPARLAPAAGVGLPLAELAIAAALIPVTTGRAAALASAVLFSGFAVAVALALVRGRRPDCGCFGRLHSAPIGVSTMLRASGLAAIAAVLAVEGTGMAGSTLADPTAWLVALTGGQSILLVAVFRRHGRTLGRLDELEAAEPAVELVRGDAAPSFTLPDLLGEPVSLAQLHVARPALLVFGHPGCDPCTTLLPKLGRWQREHARRVTVVLVTQGDAELNRVHAEEHGLELVLLQQEHEVADAYGAHGTPAAVLIDTEGRIAGPVRYGADGAEDLLAQALATGREPTKPVALAAAVTALATSPALAAPVDDEDDAIRELKRILRAHEPGLRRATQRLDAATRKLFATPGAAAVRFELLAAVALVKRALERAKEELEAVPVPDYRRGEKGARIAKSHATAHLTLLALVLDHYASAARATSFAATARHFDTIERLTGEAEKRRRLASKKLGCTRRPEEC